MKQTWKPTAAGILCIVSGAIGFTAFFILVLAIIILAKPVNILPDIPAALPLLTTGILLYLAIIAFVSGALALAGGIYATHRRQWWLALAGAIASVLAAIPFFGPLPVGVTAIILVALSRDEFTS